MKRLTTLLLLVVAILCIWLAGGRHETLVDMRQQYDLDQADPLEDSPPLVAFTTVALGGFRGLLVDALWMRLSRLQTRGKYFELVQLADWITKLEPRSAAIWSFQAWNLSYNISVMMSSPEDRWRWVHHGVELLRDEGLRYNRGSAKLYKELGWLFQHKIGSDSDHAHWCYKRQWYDLMNNVLRGPRPDYAAMKEMPDTQKELLEDPKVAELIESLRVAGIDPFEWRWNKRENRSSEMKGILSKHSEGAGKYNLFLRKDELRKRFKLSLDSMQEIEKRYGPLDWRVPESQGVYWAVKGKPYAHTEFDRDSLNRMIFQCLVALFQHGHYMFADGQLVDMPDVDLFPYVDTAFQDAFQEGTRQESVDIAYHNFLLDALVLNHYFNREKEARSIFQELKNAGAEKVQGRSYQEVVDYLCNEAPKEMPRHRALAKIDALLIRAQKLRGKDSFEQAGKLESEAMRTWKGFMSVRKNPNFRARTGLPSMQTLQKLAERQLEERQGE